MVTAKQYPGPNKRNIAPEQKILALMMEAARTSEMLVNFYQTIRHYNPKDSYLLYKTDTCGNVIII
jgi:hypothetical protein